MWKVLYTIYDTIMREYSAPFMASNDEHAKSIFDMSIANAEKAGYRSEFELVRLIKFHTGTGEMEGYTRNIVPLIPKDPQQDLFKED